MNLENARLQITTEQRYWDKYWLILSEYGDRLEFLNACYKLFPEENDLNYIYTAWSGIPNFLIRRNWFCPNFFDIRNSFQRLDMAEQNQFVSWCNYHGFDIANEDTDMLITHYQDMHGDGYYYNPHELPEETLIYDNLINTYFESGLGHTPDLSDENI